MDAFHVYVRACQYPNLSEGADRVGGQLRGDGCPFSGVTKSGRVWRKLPESEARSVHQTISCLISLCSKGLPFALLLELLPFSSRLCAARPPPAATDLQARRSARRTSNHLLLHFALFQEPLPFALLLELLLPSSRLCAARPTYKLDAAQPELRRRSARATSNPDSKHWFTTSFLQPLPYLVTP